MRANARDTESLVCRMQDKASFVGWIVVLATKSEVLSVAVRKYYECQNPKSMTSKRKVLCVWLG